MRVAMNRMHSIGASETVSAASWKTYSSLELGWFLSWFRVRITHRSKYTKKYCNHKKIVHCVVVLTGISIKFPFSSLNFG